MLDEGIRLDLVPAPRPGIPSNGQTCGIDGGPQGAPDLILVAGTNPDGVFASNGTTVIGTFHIG